MEEKQRDAGEKFESLRQVVEKLRSEEGCPWDRAQTMESLIPCIVNETAEAVAGIDLYKETKDGSNLCEELGDVLLQVMLLSQIAEEQGLFQVEDVVERITQKMIRRHPHVFGEKKEREAEEVPGLWEEIKRQEKKGRTMEQEIQQKQALQKAVKQVVSILTSK